MCLATIFLVSIITKRNIPKANFRPLMTQSRSFQLLGNFIYFDNLSKNMLKPTQSKRHFENSTMRVLFIEDKAYWIKNNALYVAEIRDGEVDESSAIQVDTMAMNKVELDKTIFIVEKLREGLTNDFGYPGDTKL